MEMKIFLTAFIVYLIAQLFIKLAEFEDIHPAFAFITLFTYMTSLFTMAASALSIIWK
jgi:hypothetical protein